MTQDEIYIHLWPRFNSEFVKFISLPEEDTPVFTKPRFNRSFAKKLRSALALKDHPPVIATIPILKGRIAVQVQDIVTDDEENITFSGTADGIGDYKVTCRLSFKDLLSSVIWRTS